MSNKADAVKSHLPKLRFPEFQDAPEWEGKRLIDVASKKVKWSFIGGPFGSNLKASDYTDTGIRIIQLQNIGDAEFIDKYKIFTSKQKADELLSCNIYPGDIILSKMGDPVARACLIPNFHPRYVMCSDGIRLVVDTDKYDKFFIYLYINSDQFRKLAEKAATGSTRKRIGLDDLKNLSINAPKFAEQQKIADCLTSLDDLIAAHAQKLGALESHKKGLMQGLFPAAGESLPQLRFPEFQDAGEWKEKNLGDIAENLDNKRVPVTESNRVQGEIPYYGASGIIDYINEFIFDEDLLCISEDGANLVARTYPIAFSISGKSWVNNHAHVLRFENKSTQKIIENYLNSINLDDFLTGMAQPKLNKAMLDSIPFSLPEDIDEQQKIADCLTSLDEQIAAQSQKLEALKVHKKGLMQGLFPSVEEAQG